MKAAARKTHLEPSAATRRVPTLAEQWIAFGEAKRAITETARERLNPSGLSPRLCDGEGKRHGYPTAKEGSRRRPSPRKSMVHGRIYRETRELYGIGT